MRGTCREEEAWKEEERNMRQGKERQRRRIEEGEERQGRRRRKRVRIQKVNKLNR